MWFKYFLKELYLVKHDHDTQYMGMEGNNIEMDAAKIISLHMHGSGLAL